MFLESDDFDTEELIFEDGSFSIWHGKRRRDNRRVFLNYIQLIVTTTVEWMEFLKNVHTYQRIDSHELLPILGVILHLPYVCVVYENNGYEFIKQEKYSEENALRIVKDLAMALGQLHICGIPHLRVKTTSIVSTKCGKYMLGFMMPKAYTCAEKDDRQFPLGSQDELSKDVFCLGLVFYELLTNTSRISFLSDFWRFRPLPTISYIPSSLSLNQNSRPGILQIIEQLHISYFVLSKQEKPTTKEFLPILESLCLSGCCVAQALVGTAYLTGNGVDKDCERGLGLLRYAVETGDPAAMNNVATSLHGHDEEFIRLLTFSAEHGYFIAQKNLGMAYLRGDRVTKDRDQAKVYLEMAANQYNVESMCIYSSLLKDTDPELSFEYLKRSAHLGDARAIHMIGIMLQRCEKRDEGLITSYYGIGVQLGHPYSMNNLGLFVEDQHKSFELWKQSAELGAYVGMYNLALCYLLGRGVEQNIELGAYWMKKSAELGYERSIFNYAIMLRDGIGFERDEKMAEYWCQKGAELRDIRTMKG